MNWSLFLLNQLIEDAIAVQARERPFTYSWLLILIALVSWMDPEDYQRMMVEAIEVCKNARCQKLWWVEEPSRQADCAIHFWVYREALQEAVVKAPRLLDTTIVKYQGTMWFTIELHTIHI